MDQSQQYVGRAMRANRPLDLPTKHKVATGEVFRYLQAHLDRGAMAHMWVAGGTVTLLDEDVTIPMPAEPVGAAGRRRGRAAERALAVEAQEAEAPADDAPAVADPWGYEAAEADTSADDAEGGE